MNENMEADDFGWPEDSGLVIFGKNVATLR